MSHLWLPCYSHGGMNSPHSNHRVHQKEAQSQRRSANPKSKMNNEWDFSWEWAGFRGMNRTQDSFAQWWTYLCTKWRICKPHLWPGETCNHADRWDILSGFRLHYILRKNILTFARSLEWSDFCHFDTRGQLEKERPIKKMPPKDQPVDRSVEYFLDLFNYWYGSAQTIRGGAPPPSKWSWVVEESNLSKLWDAS